MSSSNVSYGIRLLIVVLLVVQADIRFTIRCMEFLETSIVGTQEVRARQ